MRMIIPLLLWFNSLNAQVLTTEDCATWKLKYTSGSYKMYMRECANSPIKEVKIIDLFSADLNHLAKVVSAVETTKKITPTCAEARLIKPIDENNSFQYFRYSMPMGIKDRDLVCKVTTSLTDSCYTFISETVDKTDLVSLRTDAIRIKNAHTSIVFKKNSFGLIEMEYVAFANPNGSIPAWIINLIARKQVHSSIVKLKKMIQE